MNQPKPLILGEFQRKLDDRYRLSIPGELTEILGGETLECMLAKERPGCLSLWNAAAWKSRLEHDVELVRGKWVAGKLEGRISQLQVLGRLLSTRHREVPLTGRGRLLIPEGFREFLGVEPGGDVTVVGAALCVELWRPDAWLRYLEKRMPRFRRLIDRLSG